MTVLAAPARKNIKRPRQKTQDAQGIEMTSHREPAATIPGSPEGGDFQEAAKQMGPAQAAKWIGVIEARVISQKKLAANRANA